MLLVLLACAARQASELPTLGVPVVPTAGSSRSSFGVGVPVPAGATDAPWVASDPHVACTPHGGILSVDWVIDGTAAWPYALPDTVSCTQAERVVRVRTAFRPPPSTAWYAADGTLVIPRQGSGATLAGSVRAPSPDVVSAAIDPAVVGVSCAARTIDGAAYLDYDIERVADDRATCRLTLADGSTRAQAMVFPVY